VVVRHDVLNGNPGQRGKAVEASIIAACIERPYPRSLPDFMLPRVARQLVR
jgi:hypothetical protein